MVSRSAQAVVCAILLGLVEPVRAQATELIFQLVPEEDWLAGRSDPGQFVPGQFLLYPVGSFEPALVVDTGQPVKLPAGEWTWIGEAPGRVTVLAGMVAVDRDDDSPVHVVVTPAVPACKVRVRDREGLQRLDRLDVVSIDRGAVYPLVGGVREESWVPAGSILTYGVGARGLTGISHPVTCSPSAEVEIGLPAPPPAGHQDLMVSFQLPGPVEHEPLKAKLVPAGGAPVPLGEASGLTPTAAAWTGQRVTFFFLGAPAGDLEVLVVAHPELRSEQIEVEPRPREARDLGSVGLRPRPDLMLTVDYRPLRPHSDAELRLYHCGARRAVDSILDSRQCREISLAVPLEEGMHEVRFPALDTGQYQVDAEIDDERIAGAGSYVVPYLAPDEDEFAPIDRIPLWEFEIFGNLLRDGEAVPGMVRLDLTSAGMDGDRTFRTADDGFYRLSYFATVANRYDLRWAGLPADEIDRPPVERMGLFTRLGILQACSTEGFCRVFHERSMVMGGGRLDLELGDSRELELTVTDAETGDALPGAQVLYRPASQALRFRDGRVWFDDPPDAHPAAMSADREGTVRLRGLPEGEVRLNVFQDGYRPARRSVEVPTATRLRLAVALEPDTPVGATRISLRGGGGLGGATVLIFSKDGRWNRGCSKAADAEGLVVLAAECLDASTAVVIHPLAAITPLPAQSFGTVAEVELSPAPQPPLVLRARDGAGAPLAGIPIIVELGEVKLGPDELGFASANGGFRSHLKTDAAGEVALLGVDPDGPVSPAVALLPAPEEKVDLSAFRAGDFVDLILK